MLKYDDGVLGIRYKSFSEETPWSSSFEEESWFGILGEEVSDGLGVSFIGISGGYRSIVWDEIKSNGTSNLFFESIVRCSTSHECGWLGLVELFLVLCLLAIN